MSGKWLELLRQIAPRVTRAAVLRNSTQPTGIAQLAAMHSVAPALGIELVPIGLRDPEEIERGVTAFVRGANGGLIVTSGGQGIRQGDLIVALATRHRLPAIYPYRFFAASGGLMSYGTDTATRIGARPATSIASSKARSRPTFRCRCRPSTSWSSTSRLPEPLDSRFRPPCSPAQTR